MTRTRVATGITISLVCGLGATVLILLGAPAPAAVVIGVAAAAATVFGRWARSLHSRRRDADLPR